MPAPVDPWEYEEITIPLDVPEPNTVHEWLGLMTRAQKTVRQRVEQAVAEKAPDGWECTDNVDVWLMINTGRIAVEKDAEGHRKYATARVKFRRTSRAVQPAE